MRYFYTIFDTELGWIAMVGSDAGLRYMSLPQSGADKALRCISEFIPYSSPNSAYFNETAFRLQLYFEGEKVDFPDELDLKNTTLFQRDVWEATRTIPYGQTQTYGWIAQKIGNPKSARGVGQALARNPLPVLIPCHRVIGANGSPGGYSGGIQLKRTLLDLESSQK